MTITVGTDTYLSVSEADIYWNARNNASWSAATIAEKERCLLEATQYIDGHYDFIGVLNDLNQPLAWPRAGAVIHSGAMAGKYFDSDEIPQAIKNACAELALECLTERLVPTTKESLSKVKVDVIEVTYSDFEPSDKSFAFVRCLLKGLTIGGGRNQIKLTRC